MGDLTANLSAREFACECTIPGCTHKEAAHMPLVLGIQAAADYFKQDKSASSVRVTITGPNRCRAHNIAVQLSVGKTQAEAESSESKHIYLIAADFKLDVLVNGVWEAVPPREVFDYLDDMNPDSCGLGLYNNRVHYDTRPNRARWGL